MMNPFTNFAALMGATMTLSVFTGCGSSTTNTITPTTQNTIIPVQNQKVRFIHIGDAGDGSAKQLATGKGIAAICNDPNIGCDFVIDAGDNIYVTGVNSPMDVQLKDKFEVPYKEVSVPFFMALGNHDNGGNGAGTQNFKGDFEVDYHYLGVNRGLTKNIPYDGTNPSGKWRMPARYYHFSAPLVPVAGEVPLIDFFSLDSNPITSGDVDERDPAKWDYINYENAQRNWFLNGITRSQARWKIAFAHHPYVSNGLHGNAGRYDGKVNPALPSYHERSAGARWKAMLDATLCAKRMDFFLQGHDHDTALLQPVSACNDKTQFVLSGSAGTPRPPGALTNLTYYQTLNAEQAFVWFEFSYDSAQAVVYTVNAAGVPTVVHRQTYLYKI